SRSRPSPCDPAAAGREDFRSKMCTIFMTGTLTSDERARGAAGRRGDDIITLKPQADPGFCQAVEEPDVQRRTRGTRRAFLAKDSAGSACSALIVVFDVLLVTRDTLAASDARRRDFR